MAYGFLLVLALFLRFGPDIPFRRMLNRHLVERPIRFLLSHERHQYIFFAIVPFILLLGGEAVLLFGPELMMAYAADVALYIDAVVIAAVSGSWTRVQNAIARFRSRFGCNPADRCKRGATPRSRRTRSTSALPKANNDDDSDRPEITRFAATQPCAMAA